MKKTEKDIGKTAKKLAPLLFLILGILLLIGNIFYMNKNEELREAIEKSGSEIQILQKEKTALKEELQKKESILKIMRSKNYETSTLLGNQTKAPQAYSRIYVNQKEKTAFIDIQTLPEPEENKAYQLWSLQLEPFSSTYIGIMNDENLIGDGLYKFIDFPKTNVLCITMEPKDGSEQPTMSQIYAMEMGSDK